MMTRAYRETYLGKAQSTLGDAFDYAVNACGIAGDSFVGLFISSEVCRRMENGEPAVLAGKSGIEIACEVVRETTGEELSGETKACFARPAEYWIGWAAAYYQWYSGRRYSEIFDAIPFEVMRGLYHTLHEADISKFTDVADKALRECFPETNLRRIRSIYGCTQSELSELSGVSLRSIQMYEQRNKDINKAAADTLYRLAKALGCLMEDLLER